MSAFECVLRGRWYSHLYTLEANAHARKCYERAIQLDPERKFFLTYHESQVSSLIIQPLFEQTMCDSILPRMIS